MISPTGPSQPDGSQAQLPRPKKRRTTEADWEGHKPKLRRLYIDERKSKKEIVNLMREQDGLDITEKQVKYWFETKWKLAKNKTRRSRGTLQSAPRPHLRAPHIFPRSYAPLRLPPERDKNEAVRISSVRQAPSVENSTLDSLILMDRGRNVVNSLRDELENATMSSTTNSMTRRTVGTSLLSESSTVFEWDLSMTTNTLGRTPPNDKPLYRPASLLSRHGVEHDPPETFDQVLSLSLPPTFPLPVLLPPSITDADQAKIDERLFIRDLQLGHELSEWEWR